MPSSGRSLKMEKESLFSRSEMRPPQVIPTAFNPRKPSIQYLEKSTKKKKKNSVYFQECTLQDRAQMMMLHMAAENAVFSCLDVNFKVFPSE
jgi:hypothetical protein